MVDQRPVDKSIGGLVVRLVEDARAFATAEVALYKAKLSQWLGAAKAIAILAVAALVLVHGAIIALFVGLVLTLQPLVGPGFATLIVVAGALALAGLLGWLAYGRVTRLTASKVDR